MASIALPLPSPSLLHTKNIPFICSKLIFIFSSDSIVFCSISSSIPFCSNVGIWTTAVHWSDFSIFEKYFFFSWNMKMKQKWIFRFSCPYFCSFPLPAAAFFPEFIYFHFLAVLWLCVGECMCVCDTQCRCNLNYAVCSVSASGKVVKHKNVKTTTMKSGRRSLGKSSGKRSWKLHGVTNKRTTNIKLRRRKEDEKKNRNSYSKN